MSSWSVYVLVKIPGYILIDFRFWLMILGVLLRELHDVNSTIMGISDFFFLLELVTYVEIFRLWDSLYF